MDFDGMDDSSERVGSLLNGVGDDWGLLASHMEDYALTSRECARRLCRIWEDTGVSKKEQEREFLDVTEAISLVWGKAVDRAKAKQAGLKARLEAAVQELHQIKCEIGEEDAASGGPANSTRYLESLLGPKGNSSLRAQYNAVLEMVNEWQGYREEKMAEFNALRDELGRLRQRLGRGPLPGLEQHPFSIQLIGQLKHEIDDLRAEKKNREMELEAILSRLRKVCIELGENDVDAASEAHPSLRFYREALPGLFQNFRRNQGYPELRVDLRPEDVEIDLSEETFVALENKIDDARQLRMEREQQASEMSDVLNNLWKVLNVPEDDMDRGIHRRLLEGPTRLHAKSMERCMMEVTRLERAQAALLRDMIIARVRDLEEVCEKTHLPMPDVTPLLPTECDDEEGLSVGSVSESLGKLMRMVDEVTLLAEKRKDIISMINELESSKGEVEWLIGYEQDEGRYRGRDCNRKLQKALKVGRMRDKMPAMISRLRDAISSWETSEKRPFIFNGEDYRSTLEKFSKDLEASMATRKPTRAPKTTTTSRLATTGRTPRDRGMATPSPSPSYTKANGSRSPMSGPLTSKWSTGSGTARFRSNAAPKKPAPKRVSMIARADSFHSVGRRTPSDSTKLPPRPGSNQHNPLQEKLNWLMQTAPAISTSGHDVAWRVDTSEGSDMSDHVNTFLTSSEMGDVTWRTGHDSPPSESVLTSRCRDMTSPSPCGSTARSLASPCGGGLGMRRELSSCRSLTNRKDMPSTTLRYKDPAPKTIIEMDSSIDRLGVLRNSG